jgi:DNA-binding CsgD family transcriptional regulator
MMEADVAEEIVEAAGACRSVEEFRHVTLAQVRRLVAYDTAIFLPEVHDQAAVAVGRPPALVELYRVNQALYTQELDRARRIGDREGAYIDTEVHSQSELQKLRFFNEIIRPQGIRTRTVINLNFRQRRLATVQLCLHGGGAHFARRALDAAKRLTPLFSLAYAAFGSDAAPHRPPQTLSLLTSQQARIARYVAGGYQNKEIAVLMHLSPNTVRNQLAIVFKRLGVSGRVALATLIS